MNRESGKIPVAVLGATGSVGQRFVALLAEHPWFELVGLGASERSAGGLYGESVRWMQTTPLPRQAAALPLGRATVGELSEAALVFSALDASVAGLIEEEFARAGRVVVSNAKSHRMDPDVPLLVAEVNAQHLDLARRQKFYDRGGVILTNPNCSTIGLVLALKPLEDAFGVEAVNVVTMQAISGAGFPGVSGMQMVDNLVPHIGEEEEKMERESKKILGSFGADGVVNHGLTVSAQCNRVPVIDGHTACVSVRLASQAGAEEIVEAWRSFTAAPQELALPSAPVPPIHYFEEPDAPQPRIHRDLGAGMAISVGRLRPCSLFDFKFVTLSHNTVRGAAGGALLVAELAVQRGLMGDGFSGALSRD